jgi:hypothetical protein
MYKRIILIFGFIFFLLVAARSQQTVKAKEIFFLSEEQINALRLLEKFDTTTVSKYFSNIDPGNFYRNVQSNIIYPEKIYQGNGTNFCGFAAFSVVLIRSQPLKYTQCILSLYNKGECDVERIKIKPSKPVCEVAGLLNSKGVLNVNPADQMWMLTLADHFKGYVNILNKKYDPGDENKVWASVNIGKFKHMAQELGGFTTHVRGSDLMRPDINDYYEYIKNELNRGRVVLFVNSKHLHPSRFRNYNLKLPTHYIVLYDIQKQDGVIGIKYWDYGLKTVQIISESRLKKLVFGIIRLNEN